MNAKKTLFCNCLVINNFCFCTVKYFASVWAIMHAFNSGRVKVPQPSPTSPQLFYCKLGNLKIKLLLNFSTTVPTSPTISLYKREYILRQVGTILLCCIMFFFSGKLSNFVKRWGKLGNFLYTLTYTKLTAGTNLVKFSKIPQP